jgi:hypothetical protein
MLSRWYMRCDLLLMWMRDILVSVPSVLLPCFCLMENILMVAIVNMAGHIVVDVFYITLCVCVTCSVTARWSAYPR